MTKLPSTKRSTIKYQKIIIFPKRSCKKRHTPEFLYYVNLQGWYIVGKGCVKKSLDNFLHTSVAIGNENTRPSKQLIKVKDDSKCRKWSGRMAISPLETVCTYTWEMEWKQLQNIIQVKFLLRLFPSYQCHLLCQSEQNHGEIEKNHPKRRQKFRTWKS